MGTRLRKEFRLLLPAWLLAVLVFLIPWLWFQNRDGFVAGLIFLAAGCAIIGASAFGTEFTSNTFAQLLVQPVARGRIWREKMLALGLSLVPFALLFVWLQVRGNRAAGLTTTDPFSLTGEAPVLVYFIPLCALCAGPLWGLLVRHTLGAAVLSLVVPPLIWLMTGSVISRLVKVGWLTGNWLPGHDMPDPFYGRWLAVMLSVYCAAACWLSYRLFVRMQVAEGFQDMAVGSRFSGYFERVLERLLPGRSGPVWRLVRNELHLQRIIFMAAAGYLVLALSAMIIGAFMSPSIGENFFRVTWILYIGFVPLVLGINPITEEKVLGVHSLQLTLPVPARTLWRVKVGVALALSLALGVVLPWLCFLAHPASAVNEATGGVEPWAVVIIVALEWLATALAMYAGSLVTNALKGILLAIGLMSAGTWIIITLATKLSGLALGAVQSLVTSENVHYLETLIPHLLPGVAVIGAGGLTLLLLVCARANYREVHLDSVRVSRQDLLLAVLLQQAAANQLSSSRE
jgi:hypothetical protein